MARPGILHLRNKGTDPSWISAPHKNWWSHALTDEPTALGPLWPNRCCDYFLRLLWPKTTLIAPRQLFPVPTSSLARWVTSRLRRLTSVGFQRATSGHLLGQTAMLTWRRFQVNENVRNNSESKKSGVAKMCDVDLRLYLEALFHTYEGWYPVQATTVNSSDCFPRAREGWIAMRREVFWGKAKVLNCGLAWEIQNETPHLFPSTDLASITPFFLALI